mgnify:CR=1 FL=1
MPQNNQETLTLLTCFQLFDLNSCPFEKLITAPVGVIVQVHHTINAGTDQYLGAGHTGEMCRKTSCAPAACAVQRALDNGVLFGMGGADTVIIFNHAPNVNAMV